MGFAEDLLLDDEAHDAADFGGAAYSDVEWLLAAGEARMEDIEELLGANRWEDERRLCWLVIMGCDG